MCGWLCLPDYWFVLWLELQRRDVCRVRRLGVYFVSRWLLLSFGGSEWADHLCCWLFLGRWRIRLHRMCCGYLCIGRWRELHSVSRWQLF